jgi:predicted AlkP superfamily pyrophosphatase or phosphodiesterase
MRFGRSFEIAWRARPARALALWAALAPLALAAAPAEYVIQISVDGMGSVYLQELIDQHQLPTFARLQAEGAWTNNARTDFDYTITLPNHTCMVTGRPVKDRPGTPAAIAGHNWVINTDPGERTLHGNRHDYIPSTFDVAHDNGLRTCMFASKSKFSLYDQSYDGRNGAPDTTGVDNGRDKIDLYVRASSPELVERFLAEMNAEPFQYSFLHFHDPDTAGHAKTWGSSEYFQALKKADGYLGQILELVTSDARFKSKTAIIISADHGGTGLDHGINSNPLNYTIPFYVWGAGVGHSDDLYSLNASSRVNPLKERPDYSNPTKQPIRNGDGGNLALMLLGLQAVPDSSINASQDLNVR